MNTLHEDCWLPRPGSWEEAVDPYDEQRVRCEPQMRKDEQFESPLEMFVERTPDMRVPASA